MKKCTDLLTDRFLITTLRHICFRILIDRGLGGEANHFNGIDEFKPEDLRR